MPNRERLFDAGTYDSLTLTQCIKMFNRKWRRTSVDEYNLSGGAEAPATTEGYDPPGARTTCRLSSHCRTPAN